MTKQVTNSELRTYKACKRKWWLAWHRRLRPIRPQVTGAAPLGTRVHKSLQHYYGGLGDPFEILQAGLLEDAERLAHDPDAVADLLKEGELAAIMLQGYFEWLGETGADQGLVVVAAEDRVVVPFPAFEDGSIELMGKLDLRLMREIDGARLFLDHKTVGSFNEAMKGLAQDEQMLHYHLLEWLDHLERGETEAPLTDGGLYNMLRKVKRTARATPPFYERAEVRHNRVTLQSYYARVYGEIVDILETERKLQAGEHPGIVAYPNPTRDCSWKCEFYAVCPIVDENPQAAEQFLADWFETRDPLDRYDTEDDMTETTA